MFWFLFGIMITSFTLGLTRKVCLEVVKNDTGAFFLLWALAGIFWPIVLPMYFGGCLNELLTGATKNTKS